MFCELDTAVIGRGPLLTVWVAPLNPFRRSSPPFQTEFSEAVYDRVLVLGPYSSGGLSVPERAKAAPEAHVPEHRGHQAAHRL